MLVKTEEQEQSALFEYASYQKDTRWQLLFAVPNGGYRAAKTGARLQKTGLKPGIPDIFLPVAISPYHGLFIEMKSKKGVVQPHQKLWHVLLTKEGYKVEICRGFEEAKKVIEDYFKGVESY